MIGASLRTSFVLAAWVIPFLVSAFAPINVANGFVARSTRTWSSSLDKNTQLWAAPAQLVWILPSEEEVTLAVHKIVENAARLAIAERGSFALAIPGGSVLKVLSTLEAGDWVSKTTLAYVNHKCVPNDDLSSSIHAKVSVEGH